LGELTSLEEFIIVVMNKKLLSKGVVDVLWQLFGMSNHCYQID
jgi:hypothetical protein